MKKKFGLIFILSLVLVFVSISILILSLKNTGNQSGISALKEFGTKIELTSVSFKNNEEIPEKFTCDSENVNPSFEINNTPFATKSLALVVEDIDAPNGTFTHWLLWNIDPNVKKIEENSIPSDSITGTNSFGKTGYAGPCPGNAKHRYVFTLYSLNSKLNLSSTSEEKDLMPVISKYVTSKSSITGFYK